MAGACRVETHVGYWGREGCGAADEIGEIGEITARSRLRVDLGRRAAWR